MMKLYIENYSTYLPSQDEQQKFSIHKLPSLKMLKICFILRWFDTYHTYMHNTLKEDERDS